MIMADVLTWFLIVVGTYLTLLCYWLASAALFPALVEGCRERYGRRIVVASLLGSAVLLPLLALIAAGRRLAGNPGAAVVVLLPLLLALLGSAAVALRTRRRVPAAGLLALALLATVLTLGFVAGRGAGGPGGALARGLLMLPLLLALAGSSGLALSIGAGLSAPDDTRRPWGRVLRGGSVLAGTFLLPFLGWFIVLPWVLASGLGTAVMTLASGAPSRSVADEAVPVKAA